MSSPPPPNAFLCFRTWTQAAVVIGTTSVYIATTIAFIVVIIMAATQCDVNQEEDGVPIPLSFTAISSEPRRCDNKKCYCSVWKHRDPTCCNKFPGDKELCDPKASNGGTDNDVNLTDQSAAYTEPISEAVTDAEVVENIYDEPFTSDNQSVPPGRANAENQKMNVNLTFFAHPANVSLTEADAAIFNAPASIELVVRRQSPPAAHPGHRTKVCMCRDGECQCSRFETTGKGTLSITLAEEVELAVDSSVRSSRP